MKLRACKNRESERGVPTVHPDLPAQAPGAQRRVLPIVLHKTHVMRPCVDAQRLQAAQVQLLRPAWVWLQYHLRDSAIL